VHALQFLDSGLSLSQTGHLHTRSFFPFWFISKIYRGKFQSNNGKNPNCRAGNNQKSKSIHVNFETDKPLITK